MLHLIGETRRRSRAINADWMDILSIINTPVSMSLYYAIQSNFESSNTDLRAMAEIFYSDFINWMYNNFGITTTHTTTEDIKAFSWDEITEQLNLYRQLEPIQDISLESIPDFLASYTPAANPDEQNNFRDNPEPADIIQSINNQLEIIHRMNDVIRTAAHNRTVNIEPELFTIHEEIPNTLIFPESLPGYNQAGFFNISNFSLQSDTAKYIIFGGAAIITGLLLNRSKRK